MNPITKLRKYHVRQLFLNYFINILLVFPFTLARNYLVSCFQKAERFVFQFHSLG